MVVHVGPRAVSVFVSVATEEEDYTNRALANVHEWSPSLSVSPPRMKNVHGALANVHEWSPSLLSPSFVEQAARRFVKFVEFEYYCARASEIR